MGEGTPIPRAVSRHASRRINRVSRHYVPSANHSLCRLKDQWRAVFDAQSPSPSYCEAAIENLKIEGEALYAKWFRKGCKSLLFGSSNSS